MTWSTMTTSQPESRWRRTTKWIGATLVSGLIGAIIGAFISAQGTTIDRPAAETFLGDYYALATGAPDETWNLLTPEFKESRKERLTLAKYKGFFLDLTKVEVVNVISVAENRFSATIEYYRGTSKASEPTTFRLRCRGFRDYLPFWNCGANDLLIDDTYPTPS